MSTIRHFSPLQPDAQAAATDRRRSNIGAALTFILITVILLFPFFETVFPIPEAEGLQVAFGDVEFAGGDNPNPNSNPNPTPNPAPPTPPTPEKTDITTVDDKDVDIVKPDKVDPNKTPTPTPPNPNTNTNSGGNPTPTPDPNALFGGFGNKTGDGRQGDPTGGKTDLGGDGGGDQGNGDGKIGNRSIREKCQQSGEWDEVGTAWVYICVDESGKVTEANFQKTTKRGDVSNITSPAQIRLAEKCAKEYKYEPAAGMGKSCGSIPIVFKRQ